MDVLRCKTPELVHKKLWTHILAYSLIRSILTQAAHKRCLQPRTLGFKGAIKTLQAFQPVIALQVEHDAAHRLRLYHYLLDAVATHRVADRPDRYEPRLQKRCPKDFLLLNAPAQRSNVMWPQDLSPLRCHSSKPPESRSQYSLDTSVRPT